MDCDDEDQKKLNDVMPLVGLYIAAASAICTLAMIADAINGFRRKKLWFPSKYFSLNATTLTLLAVAMKLPVDLNTDMSKSYIDWMAKHMSILFLTTSLANFMSSLGSMGNKEISTNVVALAILVITVAANTLIQIFLLRHSWKFSLVDMVPTIFMLHLLAKLVSMAIMVPTTKKWLEAKYQEQHKIALRAEKVLNWREDVRVDNQRRKMIKYWVMAETISPQFVMSRSVVSTTLVCFLAAMGSLGAYINWFVSKSFPGPKSVYKQSTIWIQVIQFIGVVGGTIAPTLRWFAAVNFRWSTTTCSRCFKRAFKIEAHWTQLLVDLRDDSFSGLHIGKDKYKRCFYDAKWFVTTFCIGVQVLIVALSKLLVYFSVSLISPFLLCFICIKKCLTKFLFNCEMVSNETGQSGDNTDLDLSRYVILLEGEAELPSRALKDICREADSMILLGRKEQPRNLLDLLHKSVNFNGVGQFDTNKIPTLHSEEPPNCWTLPVVTLTSIAIALPNIGKYKWKRLLNSVSECLTLAKIVEKALYEDAELENIRKGADICWVGVSVYKKWLDIYLKKTSVKCKNSKEVLQELSNKAEEIIIKFKKEEQDPIMENPINWPVKIVAANSMFRISRTILLSYEEENEQTDEGLFDQLSIMIADILAACFTNLPHVVAKMCRYNVIEKREKSVRKAFVLLGRTEQVVELVQRREWPSLDHDKAAYIEEWRALLWKDKGDQEGVTSSSSNEVEIETFPTEENLAIRVDC